MRKIVLYAAILIAGTIVGIWVSGGAIWHAVSGPPDLGRADVSATDRPINQFVACSADVTACAAPDLEIGVLAGSPKEILSKLEAFAATQPRTVRVDDASDPLHRRYVVRSALLQFPDTISIDAVPAGAGTALRISSRSQIGESDFGVKGERVRAWLAAL